MTDIALRADSSKSRDLNAIEHARGALIIGLDFLAGIALLVSMLHIVANAALRKFANAPLWATNEIVTFWYMPILILLGFALAQLKREQIDMTLIFDKLPYENRREMEVFILALTAVLCAAVAGYTWIDALHNMSIGLTGGVVGVPIWPVTFLVPIAFLLMVVSAAMDIYLVLRSGLTTEEWSIREGRGGLVEGVLE